MVITRLVAQSVAIVCVCGAVAGCATGGGAVRPSPFPGSMDGRRVAESIVVPSGVVERALALRGTPYRLGGEAPGTGLDCSGLVRHVFLAAGVAVPRTVTEQYAAGVRVDEAAMRPGDLVFFDTAVPGPSHVGIVIDRDTFVHAPGTGSVVRVDRLAAPYWTSRLRGIRRIGFIPDRAAR